MAKRATQTPEYWSTFKLSDEDADFIYNTLIEAGKPRSSADIANDLIARRVDAENAVIRTELERGTIYQPKKSFKVGEEIVIPSSQAGATVLARRPGRNPQHGTFDVYTVEFRDGSRREYAGNFAGDHALNDDAHVTRLLNQEGEVTSPATLIELHGPVVAAELDRGLQSRSAFIRVSRDWFLREMMADVNPGHLNLAEAVLDVAGGGPLPTSVILRDLGLPEDVANSLQVVSLNGALAMDDRFDEVSVTGEAAWFLRKLEPPEVRTRPALLDGDLKAAGDVDEVHAAIARNLDDELEIDPDEPVEQVNAATVALLFPHRRSGTLGWGRKLAGVLPFFNKKRVPLTFKDRANGKSFTVWLVQSGRYIWGLADWYKQYDIPAGAEIEIARTETPGTFTIDAKRHKPRREWVRHAAVRNNKLQLETAQKPTTCSADDLMAVYVDELRALDSLASTTRELPGLIKELFPEIAKLSPQGNVNVRTLYAVANVISRCSPRNVIAALVSSGQYQHMGDGYWHIGEK